MCIIVTRILTLTVKRPTDENLARPWRRGLVVSSPPATEETGAMGREIESRQQPKKET
jgi:hypothetical protein